MFTIGFILPSNRFADQMVSVFNEHNQYELDHQLAHSGEYQCKVYSIEHPADIYKLDLDADVLVARGIMATFMKNNRLGLPVVEMPLLGNELLFALESVRQTDGNRKIGVIGTDPIITDTERMGEILGLQVRYYLRNTADKHSVVLTVDQAVQDGCEVIISGHHTVEYAKSKGLSSVIIGYGRHSIWLAISEAKRVVNIVKAEQEKALRINAILDYAYEGIIAIDSAGKMTMMNGLAGRLLGIRQVDAIGIPFTTAIADSPFRKAVISDETYVNEVMAYKQTMLSVNKVPLVDHGQVVGTVITFQEITKIQEAEGKIRNKIYSLGHVARFTFDDVIGSSSRIRETIEAGRRFAGVSSNILMTGETGTGKELFAQSIHNASNRRSGPFVAINCAALPENLLESELFGYVEGAFTGAAKAGKPGLFELAHRGTIFLDEISDLPPKLQGRLLRVLQERNIMRLGHDRVISVDVRIIAATNRDLGRLAASGEFRDDLFFRLNVLKLELPPLRDRPEDIRILANHFIQQYAFSFNRERLSFEESAAELLEQLPWRGNVRELQNVCERLVVLCDGGTIGPKDVLAAVSDRTQREREEIELRLTDSRTPEKRPEPAEPLKNELNDLEQKRIEEALIRFNGNKVLAAQSLGLSRTTLWRRRKELGLDPENH